MGEHVRRYFRTANLDAEGNYSQLPSAAAYEIKELRAKVADLEAVNHHLRQVAATDRKLREFAEARLREAWKWTVPRARESG
jgi:hypothetical protein